jgi:hypothetical protein
MKPEYPVKQRLCETDHDEKRPHCVEKRHQTPEKEAYVIWI